MNTWASSPAIDSSQLRRRGATMFAKRIPLGAASIALAAAFATSLAQAQISDGVVKIGVLNDMSSVYSDITGPGSVAAARKACSPNTIHWTYDTWMLANGTGSAIVKSGGSTWFFLTADYAFGLALERDTINSIKQAAEFGIVKGGQNLAGLLVFLSDIHGLGLEKAQGLIFTETFYWDLNDQTRAFAKRIAAANNGKYPTMVQAGVYSAITHYLKAVEAGKTDDGTKVIAKMKELPTDDPLFGKGRVRMDGRKLHPAYLVEVKKPSESKGPYDYYKIRATIPADQAFRPLNEGGCSLVK